jgi:hypothetical protein
MRRAATVTAPSSLRKPHTGRTPPGASTAARRDRDRTGWTRATPGRHGPLTHKRTSLSCKNATSLGYCHDTWSRRSAPFRHCATKTDPVAGHCRYATALHGRQLSLLQMEGAYRSVERGQRTRSSINSRSVFRPPSFLQNLGTYRGRVVLELLSHYNNDPLQHVGDK